MDALALAPFGARRLDGPERAQHPFQRRAHHAHAVLGAPGGAADPRHHQADDHGGQDEHTQGDAEQHQVQQAHQHQRGDQGDAAGDHAHDRAGRDITQERGVGGHARHQVTGLGAVQPGDREPQQPVHQPPPRGQDHRLRGPLQHVAAQRAEHGVGHHQARHQQQELRDGAMLAQIVDQRPDDQRQRQAGRRGEQAQHAPHQQREAVGPHVAVHDPPGGAFAAAAPMRLVCLGGHRDPPSPAMTTVSPPPGQAAKSISAGRRARHHGERGATAGAAVRRGPARRISRQLPRVPAVRCGRGPPVPRWWWRPARPCRRASAR